MTFKIYNNADIKAAKNMRHSRETIYQQIEDIDSWLLSILYQSPAESKTKKAYCEICNIHLPAEYLELHHIAGREHDDRTITACKINDKYGCHSELTEEQKTWGPDWLIGNQSQDVRERFLFQGLRDILLLKAEKTRNMYCRLVADEFVEDIYERSKLRNRKGGE